MVLAIQVLMSLITSSILVDIILQMIFKCYQEICLHVRERYLCLIFMAIMRHIVSIPFIQLTFQYCNKFYFDITYYALNTILYYDFIYDMI